MGPVQVNVRVDFQALTDLVAYLRDVQQGKIDELARQVAELTAHLQNSTAGLKSSIETSNKET